MNNIAGTVHCLKVSVNYIRNQNKWHNCFYELFTNLDGVFTFYLCISFILWFAIVHYVFFFEEFVFLTFFQYSHNLCKFESFTTNRNCNS